MDGGREGGIVGMGDRYGSKATYRESAPWLCVYPCLRYRGSRLGKGARLYTIVLSSRCWSELMSR